MEVIHGKRANNKWERESTGSPSANDKPDTRPTIIIDTEEHRINDEAIAALGRDRNLFQRARMLVYMTEHEAITEPKAVVRRQVDDLAYRPFPIDALPPPIQGFVNDWAQAIGCNSSYLALPLLTSIAAAIGNTRRLELKPGWEAPPILWAAIVGESGTAKTPAFQLVMQPVRERERKALEQHTEEMKKYEADLARWEKDMETWKRTKGKNAASEPPEKPPQPPAERFTVSDTTVEALAPILLENPRGLLLARDELAGWIGSFDRYAKGKAGADSANWMSMFNAESIIVDRKTGTPRTIHVPKAAVCVCGGIQPTILQRVLGKEHRENGLAARLLMTCPPRRAKQWNEFCIDPAAKAELDRLFSRLYELQPMVVDDKPRPILVRLDGEAREAWIAYYDAHAVEQADLNGDMAWAWAKMEEYAARLALVIHFIRWAAGDPMLTKVDILDVASMNAGIVLAKWFKHEARRVYAMLDESDTDRDKRRLIDWIGRKGGTVTPREVQQGCRWLKEVRAAEAALEKLVKAGSGTWRDVTTTAKGGRPARAFVLSTPPAVCETQFAVCETQANSEESEGFVDVDSVDASDPNREGPRCGYEKTTVETKCITGGRR